MDITGTFRFDHPQPVVWAVLTHPDSIAAALPGVQTLTPIPGQSLAWTAQISLAFIAINAEFSGEIRLTDLRELSEFRLSVSSGSGDSRLTGSALITLTPVEDSPAHTLLTYSGEAELTGKFASFPPAIVKSVVMMLVRQYFMTLSHQVGGAN